MMTTNILRRFLPCLIILVLCLPAKSMAQSTEMLSDSLVYSIEMYQELLREYTNKKALLQQDVIATVKETATNPSKVVLNAKLEDTGIDLIAILDLADSLKHRFGVTITEEQAMRLATVNDIFEAVRPKGDTVMLAMAYYPWRIVFDSRSVHRVKVYEDGIIILGDLIELTTDSIQREIYLDELMNVYDVWCENVDAINARTDTPYSKTLIKSEKARKYLIDCMPIVYGVSHDSITMKNIMEPFAVKAYNLLREALHEQENKKDLHYTIPMYYFTLAQSSIAYHHKNKNTKAFEKQYHADFDSVEIRLSYLLSLEDIGENIRKGNIRPNYNEIKKAYNKTCDEMALGSATNWRELEPIFRNQLMEKRELWDYGVEMPDADFLDRIIRSIRNDSSNVRLEALECYVEYIVPTVSTGESVSKDKVDEYKKKRNALVKAYLRRAQYDEAYPLLEDIIKIEDNEMEKASLYYNRGYIKYMQKDFQRAAQNFKAAVRRNKNYGDAYYLLALSYANCMYSKNEYKDKLKYNLAVKVLQTAKNCIIQHAGDTELSKYNTSANIAEIDKYIESYKTHYITIGDFHGGALSSKYGVRLDEVYTYDEGVMRGESAIIYKDDLR